MKLQILDFIIHYWPSILAIAIVFLGLGITWTIGYKKEVNKFLFDLIVKAEEQLGSGTGHLKKQRVKHWIYQKTPLVVRFFLSYDAFDSLIDSLVEILKTQLKNGMELTSYDKEKELL